MSAIQKLLDMAANFTFEDMSIWTNAADEFKTIQKELQAAQDLAELRKQQIDEMNRSYELVMREGCADDEMHCTCVPALKHRIQVLEAAGDAAKKCVEIHSSGQKEGETFMEFFHRLDVSLIKLDSALELVEKKEG